MAKQTADEIIESGVCHFTVGEDLGLRLMEIAQEHLTERNNPVQALKTITESLMGCPTDLAVLILLGNMVLPVDVETQQVICQDRVKGEHDRFPKVDPIYFMESRTRKIVEYGGNLVVGFRMLQNNIRTNRGVFSIDFDYDDIFKFIAGDNDVILDELRDNREIDGIASLFETAKRFIEETMKTQSTMEWLMQTCDDFKGKLGKQEGKNYEKYLQFRGDVADTLNDVVYDMNQTLKLKFSLDAPVDDVAMYIESAREIDAVIEKGIVPVDILDNYSAGWLSPEGDYYALNGEIANMLHIQIADALQEKGLIPMYESDRDKELDMKLNPDAWLEQHGWVKIHGNNVQFAGNLNKQMGKPNVRMTDKQLELIRNYITDCHQCVIKVGWRLEKTSIGMFMNYSQNPIQMNKKFFDF